MPKSKHLGLDAAAGLQVNAQIPRQARDDGQKSAELEDKEFLLTATAEIQPEGWTTNEARMVSTLQRAALFASQGKPARFTDFLPDFTKI